MGWFVGDDFMASYGGMHEIGEEIKAALSVADWQVVAYLFNGRSGDPFRVPARRAGQIADVLDRAAMSGRMTVDWAPARVQQLADSARTAANTGRDWTWS